MVAGPDVSEMRRGDEDEVEALLLSAFPGPEEAALVRSLRADGAMHSERVMRWQGRIGAYAAISRMETPDGWFCLAPVAVLPEWQGGALKREYPGMFEFHFGTRITRQTAQIFREFPDRRLTDRGVIPTLVVLGEPAFYERCGFSLARAQRLTSPYPLSHTLIARAGDDVPEVELVYPRVFSAL